MKEIYFSVDVEADGPYPGDYSMVSIGAVAAGIFDLETKTYIRLDLDDPDNCFRADLKPISSTWLPDALAISGYSREHFMENGQSPEVVMTEFASFVENTMERHGAKYPVFAAFPLGFDWTFVYWYLCKFSQTGSPFGFSRHIDIKTEYASSFNQPISRASKMRMPKSIKSKRPHTHDPLDDAREQGELLMNILERRILDI